jgi:hypothetical protein
MPASNFWSPLVDSVLWLSKSERDRRRELKTLAFMQWRAEAVETAYADLGERTDVTTLRLADERRNFTAAHDFLQSTEADLQKMLDQMGAVGVKPRVTVKLGARQSSMQSSNQSASQSARQSVPQA